MIRLFGRTATGENFPDDVVEAVWNKGRPDPPHSSAMRRRDAGGAEMERYSYGTETVHGWEIDHVKPVAAGGTDDLENLQPLQWQNNRHKADIWPRWDYWRKA